MLVDIRRVVCVGDEIQIIVSSSNHNFSQRSAVANHDSSKVVNNIRIKSTHVLSRWCFIRIDDNSVIVTLLFVHV